MPGPTKHLATAALLAVALLAAGPVHATEGARFRVTFDAVWSAATHPTDFPSDPHFSPLVGSTHAAPTSFWEPGQLASPGIQNVAELGSTSPLTIEMVTGGARTVFTAAGLDSPGTTSFEFDVFDDDPLVTLVTMIAPSPDWFLGVSGAPLHTGTEWVDVLAVPLFPYDAGTDSGVSFESPDQVTVPQEPIAQITGFPFMGAPALGTFTFELVRLLAACENGLDDDGDGLLDGNDPGCSGPLDDSEQDPGIACDDGVDNDGDFLTDTQDPGCDDSADLSEKSPSLVCDDGADNDGDGDTDYPADDGCLDVFDPTEEPIERAPALSPGAAAVLAALLVLAARARRASRPG